MRRYDYYLLNINAKVSAARIVPINSADYIPTITQGLDLPFANL